MVESFRPLLDHRERRPDSLLDSGADRMIRPVGQSGYGVLIRFPAVTRCGKSREGAVSTFEHSEAAACRPGYALDFGSARPPDDR